MRSLSPDIRFALRIFRAHPGVTLIAVLSLALGIGVNSTVFSLIDGMVMRPLPISDPGGVVWVNSQTTDGRSSSLSWLDYLDLKASAGVFADIAVQNRRMAGLTFHEEMELVPVTVVSDNYFPLLGVQAARGRLFREELDAALSGAPAVAISDSLWQRRFGADPTLVGRTIQMNNRAVTVVGILPPGFRGLLRAIRNDIWVPASTWKALGSRREFEERGTGSFEGLARLRPGASIEQAQAQLDTVTRRFQVEQPGVYRNRRLVAATEQSRQSRRGIRPELLLLSIVGLLVLIACANVALLLLAQAEARRREIAVRLAVGAGRGRLVRQLFTECSLVALASGALAVAFAYWTIPVLPAILPPGPDFVRYDIRLDTRVFLVTLATCVATVFLFGLAPVLAAVRTDLNSVIKSGGWASRRRFAGRSILVVTQAALGVVLVACAGLLTRSFLHTQQQRIGFDTDRNMLLLLVAVKGQRSTLPAIADSISDRLQSLAGVKQAAYCRRMPLSGSGGGAILDVVIPGRAAQPGEDLLRIRYNQVSPDYFALTGTRLAAGRLFSGSEAATKIALANQTMANKFWPGATPVGQWIRVNDADTQIVGVVEDGAINHVHEPPEPFLYFPFAQMPAGEITFLVETAGEPGALLDAAKREMRAASPGLIVLLTNSLKQHVRDALYSEWVPAVLTVAVGLLGMLLAAGGMFGVALDGVNRGMRELGVRMALGAEARRLVALVLGRGLYLAGVGAILGAVAAMAVGRLMAKTLYGVSPYDPATLAASVLLVLAVAALASAYPAWKATRVDPSSVLREQ